MTAVETVQKLAEAMEEAARAGGFTAEAQLARESAEAIRAVLASAVKLRDYLLRSSVCGAPGDWYLSGPIVDGLGRGLPFPADVVAAILAEPAPAAKPEEK